MNTPEMGSERIGQEAGPCLRYLEATKEVLDKRPSVGADRHVAVELSKTGLGDLCPVFTNVLLPQVELQRGVGDEVKRLQSPGPGWGTGGWCLGRREEDQEEVPGKRGQPTGQCPGHVG